MPPALATSLASSRYATLASAHAASTCSSSLPLSAIITNHAMLPRGG